MDIKRFVKETLSHGVLFLVIVTAISIGFYKLTGDTKTYFNQYEVSGLRLKNQIFKEHKAEFNTVFLGSSRTYNQVNPPVFDSITGLTSYNLAFSAVQPFRIFDLIADVAKEKPDLDVVVIELSPLPRLFESFKMPEHVRSVDEKRFVTALDFFRYNDLPLRFQYQSAMDYTKLMSYKYIGFNSAKRWRYVLNIPEPTERFIDYGIYEKRGFYSTDEVGNDNAPLRKRQRNFEKQPEKLMPFYDQSTNRAYNTQRDAFIDAWLEATRLFSEKTKVVLLIPPRNPANSINQTTKLKNFLEKEGVTILDFSDSTVYPELYAFENSNDEVHLNLKGANIYSALLGEKINALRKAAKESNQ